MSRRALTEREIVEALAGVPAWSRVGDTIRRAVTFATFAEGIRFVDRVAVEADALDHHPDIDIRYTTVVMTLSTHSAGGVTPKDVQLADAIDRLLD